MKDKIIAIILIGILSLCLLCGCGNSAEKMAHAKYRIAMLTDSGDITDQSFNQATYEACKNFAREQKVDFQYYKPPENTDKSRIDSFYEAVNDGYNVVVVPGYLFAAMIEAVAHANSSVKIVALDLSESDFSDEFELPPNVCCFTYQEELSGYMAGYAAVREGYTKLGFLGGAEVPAVQRYGYGFIQGADDAAVELEKEDLVELKCMYNGKFLSDEKTTGIMHEWYESGTEVVFACGGELYNSVAEAAAKAGGKIIGVDTDQSKAIDSIYGKGVTLTSAMKGITSTVTNVLEDIFSDRWKWYSGNVINYGLVSEDELELNYVQLPLETWSMKRFTVDDYSFLVMELFRGERTVDDDISRMPQTEINVITIDRDRR